MSKMGISTVASYTGAQVFEAIGLDRRRRRRVLHRHRRRRIGGVGLDVLAEEVATPPPARPTSRARPSGPTASSRSAASTSGAARARSTSSTRRPSSSCSTPPGPSATRSSRSTPAAVDDQSEQLATLRGLMRLRTGAGGPGARSTRWSRSSAIVRPLLDRGHVLRLDLGRGPRDAGHRHEPARRPLQHRRGRRGPRPLHARRRTATSRRSAIKQVASGRFGVTERVPGQRRRPPDQDRPGRQARRGRPAAGQQGLPVDRRDPVLDAGRRA